MSIYGLFARKGLSGFGYRSTAEQVTEGVSLAGRTVLLTGCNSGLGLEAMRVLVLRGARVIGTARSLDKAEPACSGVGGETFLRIGSIHMNECRDRRQRDSFQQARRLCLLSRLFMVHSMRSWCDRQPE